MSDTFSWEIKPLTLSFDLVRSLALSSLKVRMSRTYLTVLTITTSTAFLMYVMTMPKPSGANAEAERQGWIVMMALCLVVAAAGVLNTMLMSVTQRYREIGTMKCLGALDSLVLYSVLFESAILGLAGAVVGVVAGLIISILLGLPDYGTRVFAELSFDWIWLKVPGVFLVGMALTTFGAAVPAYIASKLPPIEAMRGEK